MYQYQRIRDLREDADLKQAVLAEYLQITRQQYSLYRAVHTFHDRLWKLLTTIEKA